MLGRENDLKSVGVADRDKNGLNVVVSVGADTHDIEAEIYFSVGKNYHA